MTLAQLEARVTELEAEVARLKARAEAEDKRSWLEKWFGAFRGDPYYEEAMRLGRKYRESLRPRPQKKARKKSK
ncbi:MAG TPA: hypothetical protein VNK04_13750 [Gemmataceae bacterium]|nr:hypothetical protein [Gemmataceae bacterium]